MSSNKGDINATILNGFLKGDSAYAIAKQQGFEGTEAEWLLSLKAENVSDRVTSLDNTALASTTVIEAIGDPVFVEDDDIEQYSAYGITATGWYVFARITAKPGVTMADTTISGSAGFIVGDGYVDVAVRFEVAAFSQMIIVNWNADVAETFVFKATDLAVNNLDYRVTFYVYDIEDPDHNCTTWEYALTTDTTFSADKYYYTKDENDVYTLAEVTAGETVPADTYYNHSKVTFSGMTRNIVYVCNTPIDCPQVYNLPEVEDDTHGCWFEIWLRHTGSFSSTLNVPEGVKVASEHTQAETKGTNMVNLLYTSVGGTKLWRFLNTHSTIPA